MLDFFLGSDKSYSSIASFNELINKTDFRNDVRKVRNDFLMTSKPFKQIQCLEEIYAFRIVWNNRIEASLTNSFLCSNCRGKLHSINVNDSQSQLNSLLITHGNSFDFSHGKLLLLGFFILFETPLRFRKLIYKYARKYSCQAWPPHHVHHFEHKKI